MAPSPWPATALATRLQRQGARLLAAAAAARHDPAPASVHRLRLATRRLQGTLVLAAAVLGDGQVAALGRRLRRPFRRAGRVRDLQVAASLLPSHAPGAADEGALAGVLAAALDRPLRRLHRALRGRRRRRIEAGVAGLVRALGRLPRTRGARHRQEHAILSRLATLDRDARAAAATAVATPDDLPALHRARRRLKRLRYALATVDGLAGFATATAVARLRTVQRSLGTAADLDVVLAIIDARAPEAGAEFARTLADDRAAATRTARASLAAWAARAPIALDTPGPDR
jgi:CHAD domain-containing protein